MLKLIECPRDAWQGHHPFIPTEQKIHYLNLLLRVGFDTLDFGSFVSPKAMPQVSDTAAVVAGLDLRSTNTKLLAIVANERGAAQACEFGEIAYLGYPFSISETFQLRNTNARIAESVNRVKALQALCQGHGKKLVIYISMGFGNPYGDPWSPELVRHWVEELAGVDIGIFSLSDTVGVARPEDIGALFMELIASRPELEFGAHFHLLPLTGAGRSKPPTPLVAAASTGRYWATEAALWPRTIWWETCPRSDCWNLEPKKRASPDRPAGFRGKLQSISGKLSGNREKLPAKGWLNQWLSPLVGIHLDYLTVLVMESEFHNAQR